MFFPVFFSDREDNIATTFTCPRCQSAADVAISWQDVVHEHVTVPGAKSQFGPLEVPYPLLPFKIKVDVPLNLLAHSEVICGACQGTVTVYFDCQAGGGHGETLYAIAAVKVDDRYVVEGLKSPPPKRQYLEPPKFDPMGPTTRFLSEVWFNGAQWELAIPQHWSQHPSGAHEFSTPYGATLRLGASLQGSIYGADHIPLPSKDLPEFERVLYKSTKVQADNFASSDTEVRRYAIGYLVGYAYRVLKEDGRFQWCGHFGDGKFKVYVNLLAPPQNEAYCLAAALFMLASIRFHGKAIGEPSSQHLHQHAPKH